MDADTAVSPQLPMLIVLVILYSYLVQSDYTGRLPVRSAAGENPEIQPPVEGK